MAPFRPRPRHDLCFKFQCGPDSASIRLCPPLGGYFRWSRLFAPACWLRLPQRCLAVACFSAAAATKPFTNDDLTSSARRARGPDQVRRRDAVEAGRPAQARRRRRILQKRFPHRHVGARPDRRRCRRMTPARGCVSPTPSSRSAPATTTNARCCSNARRAQPTSPIERATDRNQEADSLAFLGTLLSQRQIWRPALDALRLSLELREVADVRGQYERLRDQYGFRVLDYTVDADTASPRACFQFSEDIPARTDFSPFVALAGTDKPALSVTEKQLCVEGLAHGETYTGHAARRSAVGGARDAVEIVGFRDLCARPQSRPCAFRPSAYVLPRTGQQGIPVISVNTKSVAVEIYRISDRNLIDTISTNGFGNGDFQTSLSRSDIQQLQDSRGVSVWKGSLAVDAKAALNAETTTAFPVDQAVGDLKPGVYVMAAQPQELKNLDNNYDALATQWFIVSDLGLTAFSGKDGIHVFVNSLATTDAEERHRAAADLARQRSPGDAPDGRRGPCAVRAGPCQRGGRRRAGAPRRGRSEGRLRFSQYAIVGLRPDRSRRVRPAGADRARCLRLCRARRLSLRRDGVSHRASSRPAGHRRAQYAADARRRAARRRRIQAHADCRPRSRRPHAVVADQCQRADRHLACARFHRSEAAGDRRNHISGRGLCARPDRV